MKSLGSVKGMRTMDHFWLHAGAPFAALHELIPSCLDMLYFMYARLIKGLNLQLLCSVTFQRFGNQQLLARCR